MTNTIDGIDLSVLPYTQQALESIVSIYSCNVSPAVSNNVTGNRIDVHAHVVPAWYGAQIPETGGGPTPNWTIAGQFAFMASDGIQRSVLSISTPGSNVYLGNEAKTAALARLCNEYLAALARTWPNRFSFFANMPLPYSQRAIKEIDYASKKLGAVGLGLLSNHEGHYLGDPLMKPFFQYVNDTSKGNVNTLFVHPADPCRRADNGSYVVDNPWCKWPSLNIGTCTLEADLFNSYTSHQHSRVLL